MYRIDEFLGLDFLWIENFGILFLLPLRISRGIFWSNFLFCIKNFWVQEKKNMYSHSDG